MSREDLESKYLMLLAQRDMQAWRRHLRDVQQANLGCDDEESKRSPCPYNEEHVARRPWVSPYDPFYV
jgi:hypothetical protein